MAFDPDAFIAGKQEQQAPEIAEPTDKKSKFNPSEFIRKSSDYVPTPEPAMVAETQVEAPQPDMPMPMGYLPGPTGLKEVGQAAYKSAQPFVSAVGEGLKKTGEIYKARPIIAPAIDIAGTALFGAPPIAGTQSAMSVIDKVKAGKEAATIFGQQMSQGAPKEMLNAAGELITRPETVRPYFEMKQAADPKFAQKITEAYGAKTGGGGNNAVRALLNSQEGIAARYANPQLAAMADAYLKVVPTYGQQAMKVVAPLAKGALKVAGPAGMAYNMFEAGQMARETQLGEKLAGGQGQRAEQAFRNMNTQYGAPISPQEEQNVMASGSQRDIQALIRKKAAERVLGPVAPR